MSSDRHRSKGPLIGLDIGSFAVRAAEISIEDSKLSLRRFGQVTLPPGAVVDGEVVDVDSVAAAVKRLWSGVGFSGRRVVVGVSSQRVIVRQAEVVEMSERELRSSLQYEAADLIPIPVDEAVLDFMIVPRNEASPGTPDAPKMQILLAAAQRSMVSQHLAAVKKAGLEVVAVDPMALALLRRVPADCNSADSDQLTQVEAVVSIGANLTTIAVRQSGIVRFVRVIGIGGSNLTDAVSTEMGVDSAVAERIKRESTGTGSGDSGGLNNTTPLAVTRHLSVLVDQVRGSIDFYRTQRDARPVGRVTLTGGGAQVAGALEAMRSALGPMVQLADPLAGIEAESAGLSVEQLRQASPYLLAPIGLALWAAVPGRSITLLPADVVIRRRNRRQAVRAAFAVAVFAALLVLLSISGAAKVNRAKSQTHGDEARIVQLQRQVDSLASVTATRADLASRTKLFQTALQGNVDWVGLLAQLSVVMPPGSYLVSFAATSSASAAGTPSSAVAASGDGQVSMAVVAPGGIDAVARWLRALAVLPSLQDVVVGSETGASNAAGAVSTSFSATATVTPAAESSRSAHIPGSAT